MGQLVKFWPLKDHTDVSRGTRGLNCSLGLHLHPYFVYESREGSGEIAHWHPLANALTAVPKSHAF